MSRKQSQLWIDIKSQMPPVNKELFAAFVKEDNATVSVVWYDNIEEILSDIADFGFAYWMDIPPIPGDVNVAQKKTTTNGGETYTEQ